MALRSDGEVRNFIDAIEVDVYNLEDGGTLFLEDGFPLHANFLNAGERGRTKFESIDWDRDGDFDLIVGTPRHGTVSVADESGLPWSRNRAGAAVLLLKIKERTRKRSSHTRN